MFERRGPGEPFFSICIPQYNRTSFLVEALKSIDRQTFRDFEVCISDDCSTDGRQTEVLDFLARSRISFVYRVRDSNGRYDKNLRSSIALAHGRFCFLLCNDDTLADEESLSVYHVALRSSPEVGVATCNFIDVNTGASIRRVRRTRVLPGNTGSAVRVYRNFSFVSGVVLRRELAQAEATDRWDGAEMYQTYLATRLIALGHPVMCLDRVTVRMGVQVPGERVDSIFARQRLEPCPIIERRLPLTEMGRLVADAIRVATPTAKWNRQVEWAMAQLYLFPYVYWLVTYRRIQSRNYALGVCLGMRPRNVMAGVMLPVSSRLRVQLTYVVASACGLLLPVALFDALKRYAWRLAKVLT